MRDQEFRVSATKRTGVFMVLLLSGLVGCSESEGGAGGARMDAGAEQDAAAGGDDAGAVDDDAGAVDDDAGAEPGSDAGPGPDVTACLEAAQGKDTRTEALEFRGDDGTKIAIVRYVDPDGFGTSGTTIWLPERFGYARGAASACVTETKKLSYEISHHNFDDVMAAEVDGLSVSFHQDRVDYDQPMFFSAQAKRGETLVWGPIDLNLVSCRNLTEDQDCKDRYK